LAKLGDCLEAFSPFIDRIIGLVGAANSIFHQGFQIIALRMREANIELFGRYGQ
jgi:hypothetical protein